MFHVLTRDELDFPYPGDVELEDLETGARLRAGAGEAAARYRADVSAFLERWRSRCLAYGIGYTRIVTDQPLDAALRGYLVGRGGGRTR